MAHRLDEHNLGRISGLVPTAALRGTVAPSEVTPVTDHRELFATAANECD